MTQEKGQEVTKQQL
jgi:hypothetical protein